MQLKGNHAPLPRLLPSRPCLHAENGTQRRQVATPPFRMLRAAQVSNLRLDFPLRVLPAHRAGAKHPLRPPTRARVRSSQLVLCVLVLRKVQRLTNATTIAALGAGFQFSSAASLALRPSASVRRTRGAVIQVRCSAEGNTADA